MRATLLCLAALALGACSQGQADSLTGPTPITAVAAHPGATPATPAPAPPTATVQAAPPTPPPCATCQPGQPPPPYVPPTNRNGPVGTDGSRFYTGHNCPWPAPMCATLEIGDPFPS